MIKISKKRLWFYPILFGLLGAFLGLIVRFLFAYAAFDFPLKNIIHSHSHVMLLGFLFNALSILIWEHFTEGIDKISYKIYLALQVCVGGMLFAFIAQGYAFVSILFSTLHLWLSYVFVIRLWRRIHGNKHSILLIKYGIIFHFISSIGPYCLGPLMVLNMQESSWYQQAVFFYLHFQYFGVFFVWLLAVYLKIASIKLTKINVLMIAFSVIGLYAHSLDYSFDHWAIQLIGGISSITLSLLFIRFFKRVKRLPKEMVFIYSILIIISVSNIVGSFSSIASLVASNHFILIAWLHFLFLGLYIPFIWLQSPIKISSKFWLLYAVGVISSEVFLLFPERSFQFFNISIMWLLFIAYSIIFVCISSVHLNYLIKKQVYKVK